MQSSPLAVVLEILLFIPAIILHEVSHGYVAYLLGDPTAHDRGRLTLNPIAHVDLWGTILMPAVMLLLSGGRFAFGYAKPVPIDPRRMTRTTYQMGMLLTGAAGPVTNILLATVSGIAFRLSTLFQAPDVVLFIFYFFALINLVLAMFNLIPIPPLDGSKVMFSLMNPGTVWRIRPTLEQWGFLILIVVMIIPLNGVSIGGRVIGPLLNGLVSVLVGF